MTVDIPEGWALVPIEPNEAMLDALHNRIRILVNPADKSADIQNDREVWSAMLAAAPTPTTPDGAGVDPVGGECEACDGNGYSGGEMPAEDMRGEMDVCCEVCLGTGKATQPAPMPGEDEGVHWAYSSVMPKFVNVETDDISHYEIWVHTTLKGDDPDGLYDRAKSLIASMRPVPDDVEHLRHVIDRDRYVAANAHGAIEAAISRRAWLSQPGRGSYEYDDERYQLEFGLALDEIREALKPLLRLAKDKTDCTRDPVKVQAARDAAQSIIAAAPDDVREVFAAGFHAAERALGYEGCDESEDALAIEWEEYSALSALPAATPTEGEG
jgi:hypothetical protein